MKHYTLFQVIDFQPLIKCRLASAYLCKSIKLNCIRVITEHCLCLTTHFFHKWPEEIYVPGAGHLFTSTPYVIITVSGRTIFCTTCFCARWSILLIIELKLKLKTLKFVFIMSKGIAVLFPWYTFVFCRWVYSYTEEVCQLCKSWEWQWFQI